MQYTLRVTLSSDELFFGAIVQNDDGGTVAGLSPTTFIGLCTRELSLTLEKCTNLAPGVDISNWSGSIAVC